MLSSRSVRIRLITVGLSLAITTTVSAETKLLRFPDIHGNQVAFCHGGDLWRAPAKGGTAIRITAHPGQKLFPRVSRPTANGSLSRRNMTATSKFTSCRLAEVSRVNLPTIRLTGPLAPRWGFDNQGLRLDSGRQGRYSSDRFGMPMAVVP